MSEQRDPTLSFEGTVSLPFATQVTASAVDLGPFPSADLTSPGRNGLKGNQAVGPESAGSPLGPEAGSCGAPGGGGAAPALAGHNLSFELLNLSVNCL